MEVTPIEQRQIGICLMEMAIYVAELFILPFGFVIDRSRFITWIVQKTLKVLTLGGSVFGQKSSILFFR